MLLNIVAYMTTGRRMAGAPLAGTGESDRPSAILNRLIWQAITLATGKPVPAKLRGQFPAIRNSEICYARHIGLDNDQQGDRQR